MAPAVRRGPHGADSAVGGAALTVRAPSGPTQVPPLVFKSRVDTWLVVVLLAPLGALSWQVLRETTRRPSAEHWIIAAVAASVIGLVTWLFAATDYTITGPDLTIRSGPFRTTIPIASIRRIRASRTLLAGPALSLRRLELDHGTYDVAIVSPKDRDGFVAALVARNPAITVRDA